MSERRRPRLIELVIVAALAAISVVSIVIQPTNSVVTTSGLSSPSTSESTALYCTGFTGVRGPAPASLLFVNISDSARAVTITVASNKGASTRHAFSVPARGQFTIAPGVLGGSGNFLGVTALVNGGGVAAVIRGTRAGSRIAPCTSSGTQDWATSGLSTKVGWHAIVTLLNPTATASVVNVDALTPAGYSAPQMFQGVVVGAHGEVALDLGTQIVSLGNIAARVHVVRGTVVAAAIETWSKGGEGASIVTGANGAATNFVFPDVPTNASASTILAVANPSSSPAHVVVDVSLAPYTVSPFSIDLGAGAVANLAISPTSRIPAVGAAALRVSSNVAIIATVRLSLNGASGSWLVSPAVPALMQVVVDATRGFVDGALLAGSNDASVAITHYSNRSASAVTTYQLTAGSTRALGASDLAHWAGGFTLLSSNAPVTVALTGADQRAGVLIVASSGGR